MEQLLNNQIFMDLLMKNWELTNMPVILYQIFLIVNRVVFITAVKIQIKIVARVNTYLVLQKALVMVFKIKTF